MDRRCIICDHPMTAHTGAGCLADSFLRGRCDCDFQELPPLPRPATPARHLARADWWLVRTEMALARQRRARPGTERWWRLDRFLDVARMERSRDLAMAAALEAGESPASSDLPEKPPPASAEPSGDDLLDLVSIDCLTDQEPATLAFVLDHLERSDDAAQVDVRARLTAEFDALEPRHRRVLLEDDAQRGFLERAGVCTWIAEAPSEGSVPDLSRAHVEGYWRYWAQAPSPETLIAYIAMDPDEFKRYLELAISVLTLAERSRFATRGQLHAWIVSGMRPLSRDGEEVPLDEVIDRGYLPTTAF
jgi:hypothetical protein